MTYLKAQFSKAATTGFGYLENPQHLRDSFLLMCTDLRGGLTLEARAALERMQGYVAVHPDDVRRAVYLDRIRAAIEEPSGQPSADPPKRRH